MFSKKPYTFDRVVRLLIGLSLAIFALWLINLLKDVLLPFVVACLIAYILEPFVQYNRSILHLKGRTIASLVTIFEITTILVIAAYFFLPAIFDEMQQVARMMKQYATSDVSIAFLPDNIHSILRDKINFEYIAKRLTQEDIQSILDHSISFISGGVGMIMSVIEWLLVFLYILFIMIDYDNLMRGFRMFVPPEYRRRVFKLGNDIKNSMNHYFRGQALIASIVAVCYSVGFSLVGIPLAIILGISAGILFMVPYMVYITIIPVTILCLVYSVDTGINFWTIWWECIAVYAVTQCLSDLILTPKIMGKAMGLNPAIILLSLSIWGTLLGLIGMIIALPLTTLLISYYNEYLIKRSQRKNPKDTAGLIDRLNPGQTT